jgi:hypothetical protein
MPLVTAPIFRAGVSLSERKTLTPALTTAGKLTQNLFWIGPPAMPKIGRISSTFEQMSRELFRVF